MLYGTELCIVMTIVAKGRILGIERTGKPLLNSKFNLLKQNKTQLGLEITYKNFRSLLRNC